MKELKLFGMRMKELRAARNLSQERLADKSGISPKYMSRIEMGLHFPSFDIITKLSQCPPGRGKRLLNLPMRLKIPKN